MRIRATLALVVALAGLALGAPSATAARAAASDPVYPPTVCATIFVSTTNPLEGASIGVTGENFFANATTHLYIKSPHILLRTVKTDGDGRLATTVKLPDGLFGHRILQAEGGHSGDNGCAADPFQIQQGAAASQSGGGGGSSNGGGTAFTGVDVAGLLAIAAALVGVGVLLNRRGRNAKRVSTRV